MKLVTRDVFSNMQSKGYIKYGRFDKNFYISSAKKKSRRKKLYVCEADLSRYLSRYLSSLKSNDKLNLTNSIK